MESTSGRNVQDTMERRRTCNRSEASCRSCLVGPRRLRARDTRVDIVRNGQYSYGWIFVCLRGCTVARKREDGSCIYTPVSRYRLLSGLPSLHPEIVTRSRWRKHASAYMTSVCDNLIIEDRKALNGGTRAVSTLEPAALRCARCM